jgi:acetate kinase
MPDEIRICQGLVERIGTHTATLRFKAGTIKDEVQVQAQNHREALEHIVAALLHPTNGVLKHTSDIAAVGHRVVHGGTIFNETTRIDTDVKQAIASLAPLAPLHNPHNLEGIILSEDRFPKALQVAVFDTAFHCTLPDRARRYALPKALFAERAIQVFGFHGTSHKYVSEQVRRLLPQNSKLITLHLGNGCSATAVLNGQSIDHSLGFTPTGGLIMGTRSGDLDPGIVPYLIQNLGYSVQEAEQIITRESGLKGLTGFSDMRDVEREAAKGNPDCILALDLTAYRLRKYIGAYVAVMNGLDGLVFTGGIGENSSVLRQMVCSDLEVFGITLDTDRNTQVKQGIHEIQALHSRVRIWIVPTDEELEIARQTFDLLP